MLATCGTGHANVVRLKCKAATIQRFQHQMLCILSKASKTCESILPISHSSCRMLNAIGLKQLHQVAYDQVSKAHDQRLMVFFTVRR